MRLDIRLPIGLMFLLIGLLLVGYGLVSDPALYARTAGVNVNLWWGGLLVAFGAVMFGFGRRAGRS